MGVWGRGGRQKELRWESQRSSTQAGRCFLFPGGQLVSREAEPRSQPFSLTPQGAAVHG